MDKKKLDSVPSPDLSWELNIIRLPPPNLFGHPFVGNNLFHKTSSTDLSDAFFPIVYTIEMHA